MNIATILIIGLVIIAIGVVAYVAMHKPSVRAEARDLSHDVQRGARDTYNGVKDAAEDAKDKVKDAAK